MSYKQVDTLVISAEKHCDFDKANREQFYIQKLGSQQTSAFWSDLRVGVEITPSSLDFKQCMCEACIIQVVECQFLLPAPSFGRNEDPVRYVHEDDYYLHKQQSISLARLFGGNAVPNGRQWTLLCGVYGNEFGDGVVPFVHSNEEFFLHHREFI